MPELVAPGGSLEKVKTAVLFGADSVYVGLDKYSLRSAGLSLAELKLAIRFAHKYSVKIYLAVNIFTYDSDYAQLKTLLEKAIGYGIDAVIVADPGLVFFINKHLDQKPKIHLSTQANTTNSSAVKFWQQQGVSRIVLARELNFEQIKEIKKNVPEMELEVFVHGAMCMAYSGRCLLSAAMADRSANRGDCAQPCRWSYTLQEASRPQELFELQEDQRGSFILNSKDLCLLEKIPELIDAGIDALKIEGRMKPAYYTALVTKTYREALDRYLFDRNNFQILERWQKRLAEVSHRPYTLGFTFPNQDSLQNSTSSAYLREYSFVGVVKAYRGQTVFVDVRNKISTENILEFIDPHFPEIRKWQADIFTKDTGEKIKVAHNQYRISFSLPFTVSKNSLIRIKLP